MKRRTNKRPASGAPSPAKVFEASLEAGRGRVDVEAGKKRATVDKESGLSESQFQTPSKSGAGPSGSGSGAQSYVETVKAKSSEDDIVERIAAEIKGKLNLESLADKLIAKTVQAIATQLDIITAKVDRCEIKVATVEMKTEELLTSSTEHHENIMRHDSRLAKLEKWVREREREGHFKGQVQERAAAHADASTSASASPWSYNRSSLTAFAVPYSKAATSKEAYEKWLMNELARVAKLGMGEVCAVERFDDPRKPRFDEAGLQLHSVRFTFAGPHVARRVLKAKREVLDVVGLKLKHDLSPAERSKQRSREWAFDALIKGISGKKCWVTWNLDEIWVNEGVELKTGERDVLGRHPFSEPGRWRVYEEKDYVDLEKKVKEAKADEEAANRAAQADAEAGAQAAPSADGTGNDFQNVREGSMADASAAPATAANVGVHA
jgi:hypothetical protein